MKAILYKTIMVVLFIAGGYVTKAQIVPFSIPGATNTYITCTNDSNDVAGYYDYGSVGTHGFIYDVSADNIIYVDYPGATQTFIYGINNDMKTVGAYNTTGINTNNEGFVYDYWNFTYTDITSSWIPAMDITIARDINDADCIVGDYKESTTHVCFSMCGGTNTPFHYNYNPTYINSINNTGKRAGGWIDGSLRHGLIWDNSTWTQLDYPGATRTILTGINDSNIVVGVFNLYRSFIYRNGVFKEVSKPNATDFQIRDINNKGNVVGYYKDGTNTYKGFYSSVCEIDFRPDPDGWSFNNSSGNVWPESWYKQFNYTHDPYLGGAAPFPKMTYKTGIVDTINRSFFPDWPLFVETLGEDQCYFVNGQVKVLKYTAALKYKSLVKKWGGSCFGFVQSSFMSWDSVSRFKSAFPNVGAWDGSNKLYPLSLSDDNRKCINSLMLKQSQKSYQKYRASQWYNTPVSTLKSLRKMLLDNEKDERGLTVRNQNGSGGHIVSPYKVVIDSLDPNLEYIYIYDNNFPNDTTRKVTVDKTLNSWYYNLSVNSNVPAAEWGGDNAHMGMFLSVPSSYWYSTPSLDSVAKIDDLDESGKSNFLSVYNSPDCDILISNQSGQVLGFQAGQFIEHIPGAIPMISESGTAEPPLGYFLPDGQYNIQLKNFSNTGAVFSVFSNTSNFMYSRTGATLAQQDRIALGTNGLSVSNPDNIVKNINLSTVFENAGNEMSVEITKLGQSANAATAINVLNNEIRLLNTGAPATYDLSLRYANNSGESSFIHDTIAIASNTAHLISPDWANLKTSDVTIFVDNGNNSTNDDTLHFANEQPPAILTFPLSIVRGPAASTDTIFITNSGGGSMSWTATSDNPSWLSITGSNSGTNTGFIRVSTSLNNGAARTGLITITSAGASNSPWDIAVTQNGLLTAPTNVVASDGNYSDGVHVSWNTVPSATHYSVYRSTVAGTTGTPITAWLTGTTYIDASAVNGQVYYYSVKAAQNVSGLNGTAYSQANDGWRSCFTANFTVSGGCAGQATSFDDISAVHTAAYYLWDVNNDGTTDYTGTNIQHVYPAAANYTAKLTVTDSALCTSSTQKSISILAFPVVNLPADTSICAGTSFALNAGSGFDTYLWSTGETTSSIMADTNGVGLGCIPYYVRVSNSNGCTAIDQTAITWSVCTDVSEISNELSFNLYPNPTSGLLNISINGIAGRSSISIYNNSLQMVYHDDISEINGNYFRTADLNGMAAGMYFMRFVSDDIVKVAKVVVY